MSHAIDFDGLYEKLFLLRHLVHGATTYCVAEDIRSESEADIYSYDGYWASLKVLLSNYLIESAVKARMIQEFCQINDDGELIEFEKEAVETLSIGTVIEGDFRLTLREASNKIIHSTRARIEFKEINTVGGSYQAWDGKYHLYGKHRKDEWHLALDVDGWAKAMSLFLEILSDNEITLDMGQDF